MKNKLLLIVPLIAIVLFTSCTAVETIFKAGMWWALFLVSIVIGIILYIVFRMRRK